MTTRSFLIIISFSLELKEGILCNLSETLNNHKKSAGSWHLRVQRNCNARASNWVYKLRVASLCTFNSTDVFGQWIRFGNILLRLATANHKDCCFKFQNWSRDEIFGWAWSEDFFTFEWSHKPSQPHRNLACNSGVHYWLQGFLYTTQK